LHEQPQPSDLHERCQWSSIAPIEQA
jgi:hypothetical protein